MFRSILTLNCGKDIAALGKENCSKFMGLPKGFAFTEDNTSFNLQDVANMGALLELLNGYVHFAALTGANVRMPSEPLIFPYYPSMVNLEPTGGDANLVTEGWGGGIPNGINPYSEIYTITDGGNCMYKQLLKFKGRTVRVFLIDDTDTLYGNVDSKGVVRGFQVYVSVTKRKNTGTQTAAIRLQLSYTNEYETAMEREIALPLGEKLETLREVSVSILDVSTGAFDVVSKCSGVSVVANNPLLGATFVANKGVFTLDGVTFDGTISYSTINKCFILGTPEDVSKLALHQDMYNINNGASTILVDEFKYLLGDTDIV